MAAPLKTTKQSVNLASDGPRVSKIRRDPPPPAAPAKLTVPSNERDQYDVTVGVLAFAFALFVIIIGVGAYSGWSIGDYIWKLQ